MSTILERLHLMRRRNDTLVQEASEELLQLTKAYIDEKIKKTPRLHKTVTVEIGWGDVYSLILDNNYSYKAEVNHWDLGIDVTDIVWKSIPAYAKCQGVRCRAPGNLRYILEC